MSFIETSLYFGVSFKRGFTVNNDKGTIKLQNTNTETIYYPHDNDTMCQ